MQELVYCDTWLNEGYGINLLVLTYRVRQRSLDHRVLMSIIQPCLGLILCNNNELNVE